MAELNMNLNGVDPYDNNYELLPPGEYPVRITNAELRFPRSGCNQYLSLRYDVLDGPKRGRVLFEPLNLWSQNPTAREIAARKLKSIGVAIRLPNPDYIADSNELMQGEMIVRVVIRKDDSGQYGDKNDIKGYKPLQGVNVAAGPVPTGATPSEAGWAASPPPASQATPPPASRPDARPATPWAQSA